MTISPATSRLSKPTGEDPIAKGKLGYLRARYRLNVHSLVLEEMERSGITKATLARRLRMDPAQLTRLLSNPSNMSQDTLSDLLFAISGKEPSTRAVPFGESDQSTVAPNPAHVVVHVRPDRIGDPGAVREGARAPDKLPMMPTFKLDTSVVYQ